MFRKRTTFTTVTPLPRDILRSAVLDVLHDHVEMIDLNPLVHSRQPIECPSNVDDDERSCAWYSITDKVSYLPGGRVSNNINYTSGFLDLPRGIQTHCRAPMGVDIRALWTVCGTLPHEPSEPVELGIKAPGVGLYLREDVSLTSNVLVASFVKKSLQTAHATLVERLIAVARSKMTADDDNVGEQASIDAVMSQSRPATSSGVSTRRWTDTTSMFSARTHWPSAPSTTGSHQRSVSDNGRNLVGVQDVASIRRRQSMLTMTRLSTTSEDSGDSADLPMSPRTPTSLGGDDDTHACFPQPLRTSKSIHVRSDSVDSETHHPAWPQLSPYGNDDIPDAPPPFQEKNPKRMLSTMVATEPLLSGQQLHNLYAAAPLSATLDSPWSADVELVF